MTYNNTGNSNPSLIDNAAKLLLSAAQTRQWITELPPSVKPSSFEAAYAIQESCYTLSGRTAAGWKIGCTSEEIQQLLGSDSPITGRLFKDTIYQNNNTLLNYRTDMMLIEAEFAFVMGADLPQIKGAYDMATVLPAVESVLPAIEVVHERYSDWKASSLLEKIADNSGYGSLIIGTPCSIEDAGNLQDQGVIVKLDGTTVSTGNGSLVLGDPYNALVWLANMLSERGIGLRKGDIVTSGSCTGITEAPKGAKILVEFDTLGSVAFQFG